MNLYFLPNFKSLKAAKDSSATVTLNEKSLTKNEYVSVSGGDLEYLGHAGNRIRSSPLS